MFINPSRDVVVSLACYSYFRSAGLRGVKSGENNDFNGDVTLRILWNFQIQNTSATECIFALRIFIYHTDKHMVHKKVKCTPLPSYISGVVNVEVGLNELMMETFHKVFLYTINVERICDAKYVIWKYRR